MMKVPVSNLEVGMKLARDVVLKDGKVLLLRGFTLKNKYIEKLSAFNVDHVYVEKERAPLDSIKEEKIYTEAFGNVRRVMENIRIGDKLDAGIMKQTVHEIVAHVLNHDIAFMSLTGIRDIDNYTFLHCVDVCIYSAVAAKALNLSQDDIVEVALAGLLHDIGKCKIPLEILNKPGKLTNEEFNVMKHHALYGMEIIRNTPGLSEKTARIVSQHHEKWDGTGYPFKLKGNDIDYLSRIVSISDVFDALSADRVYRKRFLPHEAAEYLLSNCETQFDPKILNVFVSQIAVYPEDTVVMLNTGEIGRVLFSKGCHAMRPTVSVITRKDGPPIFRPYVVNLADHPSIMIVDIIS